MSLFTKLGAEIWRAFDTDGVPSSGPRKVSKTDMRAWMLTLEGQTAAVAVYYLSAYASLAAALSAIGSSTVDLVVDVSATVAADTTIPANITLRASAGCILTVNTTKTLTVNGPIAVPSGRQIFSCSGTGRVALDASLGHALCDVTWFGAKPNYTNADDGPYINAAINSRADWVICTGQFALQTAIDFTPWSTVGDAADAMKTFSGLGARFVQAANLTTMINLSPTDGGQIFRKRIQIGRLLGGSGTYTLTQCVKQRCCSSCILEFDAIENGAGIGYLVDQTSTPAHIAGNNLIRIGRIGGHTGDGFQAKADTSGAVGFEASVVDIGESGFNGGMGVQLGTGLNQRVVGNIFRIGTCDGNTGRGVYAQCGGNVIDIGALSSNGTADLDCLTGITSRNRIRVDISVYAPVFGTAVLREHGLNGQPATYRDTASNTATGANTTETTLQTYTIPASTLKVGMRVKLTAWGTFAANGNTKTVRIYFGSTVVWSASSGYNANGWRAEAEVEITAANAQEYHGFGGHFGDVFAVTQGTATETDTNAIIVKATGQNGSAAASDIVGQGFRMDIIG